MKTIKEIVEAYTEDGKTDWDAADKQYQETVNGIVVKETAKTADKVRQETIEGIGIEGISSAEDVKKHTSTLQSTIEQRDKEYAEAVEKLKNLEGSKTQLEREKSLYSLGITDPDDIDYLTFNISKRVDDSKDWDTALKEYKDEKPTVFKKASTRTTGASVGGGTDLETPGWEKLLQEKHPELKEK